MHCKKIKVFLALRLSLIIVSPHGSFGSAIKRHYRTINAKRAPIEVGIVVNSQMVEEAKLCESAQRIQVELERHVYGKRVKIRVENYDSGLGWYSSGSLTVPLHQLPLLEQAIDDMRSVDHSDEYADIIPFPGTMIQPAA